MAQNPWHYLQIQFVNATIENYKKAVRLSQYHDNVLEQRAAVATPDPDDELMYDRYHPLHEILADQYSAWKNAGGQQEGQTLNVEQLLELTKTKLDTWDPLIQAVHIKSSPAYKAIFPNARIPFYKGSVEQRIGAFDTLQLALTNLALAAVKAQVIAHHLALINARSIQTGAIAATGTGSVALEEARVNAMRMQYADLGLLMNKHFENTSYIEDYFDLEVLRDIAQSIFTGTLDAGEVEPVLVHTFLADDVLHVEAGAAAGFKLYLGQTAGEQGANGVAVNPGEVRNISISEFDSPDLGTHRYLTAVNNSGVATTYEIELM